MKKAKLYFLFFIFLALAADSLSAKEVTLVYSGQSHAMLYPCSCPIRQDGGISRRATLIKELRKKYPELLLLDCGSFTGGGQLDEYTQNIQLDMQRSEVNYKALELMRYDAVGVSSDEFNFGREFFLKNAKKSTPAYLSANLDTDKVAPYLVKESGGVKIAIIGLTGLSANHKSEGLTITPPDMIAGLVSRLKNLGVEVVILLSTQGEKEDLKLISKIKGIDIIFVGDKPLKEEALTKVEDTFMLRPIWQGRSLGKLTLKVQDGKLSDCIVEQITLSDNFKDDASVAQILPLCYSDVNCKQGNLTGVCQNPGALKAECLYVKPKKIELLVISVKDCITCNVDPVIKLLSKNFPGLVIKNLDYPDLEAQKMIKDLSLQVLPAYVFPRSVEKEDNFESLKNDLQLVNDSYLLKPQVSGIAYFLNQELKKGSFDLFFSIFEKDAALLLTRVKEFNPSLHFLTSDKDADVVGKSNDYEKEEYSRAVCVQKYYPEKFWDYLICRSKQIKSAYWEDCLCGVDSLRVKTCARGPEGVTLLSENTRLNQQLRISSGPSYLLNNQEIFASQGVPSQEELAKILKN